MFQNILVFFMVVICIGAVVFGILQERGDGENEDLTKEAEHEQNASCITPIAFERVFVIDSLIAILAGCLLWFGVVRTKTLGKKGGIVMLAVYAAYLCYLLQKNAVESVKLFLEMLAWYGIIQKICIRLDNLLMKSLHNTGGNNDG